MSLLNTVSSPKGPRDWARIILLTGGGCQSYESASTADITIVVDADREVARIRDRPGLIKISLGGNDTALTLLARMPDDSCANAVREDYEMRPNVFLGEGMAQDPRLAELAARDFIRSGRLEPVVDQILKDILIATNGGLRHIDFWEVNGNSGGMGPGGAHEFGKFLIDEIEGRTKATTHHHQVRIGGLGYIAVAPRAARNTARSTRTDIERMLASHPVSRVRDASFVELPLRDQERRTVLGADGSMREYLTSTFCQARLSEALSRLLDARETNEKNTHELGEFSRIQARWTEPINLDEIAEDAARQYATAIETSSVADMPAFADPGVTITAEPQPATAVPADKVIAEMKLHRKLDGPLLARLLEEDRPATKTSLRLFCANGPSSIADACSLISGGRMAGNLSAAIRRNLAAFRLSAEADAVKKLETRDRLRQSLRTRLATERRRTGLPFSRFLESMKSGRHRATEAVELLNLLRELTESHQAYGEAFAILEACHEATAHLESALRSLLAPAKSALEGLIRDQRASYAPLAEFAPLGEVKDALRRAVSQGDYQSLRKELLNSVRALNLAAIGRMFGTAADPHSIADAIARGEFAWESPLWGGAHSLVAPRHRFVVLPPVSRKDLADVRDALRVLRPDLQLVAADSIAGGCAVVALDFFPVQKRDDLVPPYYSSRLGDEVAA